MSQKPYFLGRARGEYLTASRYSSSESEEDIDNESLRSERSKSLVDSSNLLVSGIEAICVKDKVGEKMTERVTEELEVQRATESEKYELNQESLRVQPNDFAQEVGVQAAGVLEDRVEISLLTALLSRSQQETIVLQVGEGALRYFTIRRTEAPCDMKKSLLIFRFFRFVFIAMF